MNYAVEEIRCKKAEELENQWETELVCRIANIGKYLDEIKSMTRKDYIVAGVIIVLCLCVVVTGAFFLRKKFRAPLACCGYLTLFV